MCKDKEHISERCGSFISKIKCVDEREYGDLQIPARISGRDMILKEPRITNVPGHGESIVMTNKRGKTVTVIGKDIFSTEVAEAIESRIETRRLREEERQERKRHLEEFINGTGKYNKDI